MIDDSSAPTAAPAYSSPASSSLRERRTNRRLRELIDEMLASVRVSVNRDLWTPQERAQAEAELAHLMDAIRCEALGGKTRGKA